MPYCKFLDCIVFKFYVLLCIALDCSTLNCSVLGLCTDYCTSLNKEKIGSLWWSILQLRLTAVFLTVVYFTLIYFFVVHLLTVHSTVVHSIEIQMITSNNTKLGQHLWPILHLCFSVDFLTAVYFMMYNIEFSHTT